MKVKIVSIGNPDWALTCTLIKETATKYIVWSNKNQTVEMHFPKDLYHIMNKTNNSNVQYEGELMNKFENKESLDFLRSLDKNSIGLGLIDPPYIISKASGYTNTKVQKYRNHSIDHGKWDDGESFTMEDLNENIEEYYRILKKGGTFITFCDIWKISHVKDMMESARFKQIRFIEWIKTNPVPISALHSKRNYLTNAREVALLGVKVGKPTFNSQHDNAVYRYGICRDKGRFHPTQKPLKFMEALIEKHSNPGDIVVDTFAGSATTLVAAQRLNRAYMGCELDTDCYIKALDRLNKSMEEK